MTNYFIILALWIIPGAYAYLRNNPDPTWEVLSGNNQPVKISVLGPGILAASVVSLFVFGLAWVLVGDIYPQEDE